MAEHSNFFWPKIYVPNVKKYPALLALHHSPQGVMQAEKQWLWNALDYETRCSVNSTFQECKKVRETRHQNAKNHYYSARSTYGVCAYDNRQKRCKKAVLNTSVPLQFLRWLLHTEYPNKFPEYIRTFPHQVTEKDYGYDEGKQYLPQEALDVAREAWEQIRSPSASDSVSVAAAAAPGVASQLLKEKQKLQRTLNRKESLLREGKLLCTRERERSEALYADLLEHQELLKKQKTRIDELLSRLKKKKLEDEKLQDLGTVTRMDELLATIAHYEARQAKVEKEYEECTAQIQAWKKENAALESRKNEIEANLRHVKKENENLEKELALQTEQTQEAVQDFERFRDQIRKQQSQIEKMKSDKLQTEEEATELLSKLFAEMTQKVMKAFDRHENKTEVFKALMEPMKSCKEIIESNKSVAVKFLSYSKTHSIVNEAFAVLA